MLSTGRLRCAYGEARVWPRGQPGGSCWQQPTPVGLLLFLMDWGVGLCPAGVVVLCGAGLFLGLLCLPASPLGWAVVLVLCCMGLLDLYRDYFGKLHGNLNARGRRRPRPEPEPAFLRRMLRHGRGHDHLPDALLHQPALPDQLPTGRVGPPDLGPPRRAQGEETPEEDALERRARDLQKQAKKLQEEVGRSGLGADMQPVPAPTVRDLSVSHPAKPGGARSRASPSRSRSLRPRRRLKSFPPARSPPPRWGMFWARSRTNETKPGDANAEPKTREAPPGKGARAQARTRGAHFRPARRPCRAIPNRSSPGDPSPLPSPPRP
jgi:hypothetical protein